MKIETDMSYCIQCMDRTSGKTGDFIFKNDKYKHAISPVFDDLMELYAYMRKRGLVTGGLADFKVYKETV